MTTVTYSTCLPERLKLRIEAEIKKRLISRILDIGVEYHTRKGIRPGCQCHYCQLKRRATQDIGNMSHHRFNSREEVDYFREMKRLRWRKALKEVSY